MFSCVKKGLGHSNSTSEYINQHTENSKWNRHLHTEVHSSQELRWRPPKSSLANEWLYKTWYVHTKEYYSVLKTILTCAIAWINFEDTVLVMKRQILYDATYMRSLCLSFLIHTMGLRI